VFAATIFVPIPAFGLMETFDPHTIQTVQSLPGGSLLNEGVVYGENYAGYFYEKTIQRLKATQPKTPVNSEAEAHDLLKVIQSNFAAVTGSGLYLENKGDPTSVTTVWSFGQTLVAALDEAHKTGDYSLVDRMMAALQYYKVGNAYAPTIGSSASTTKYFDDNAWITLALVQAYRQTGEFTYLQQAMDLMAFLTESTKVGKYPDTGAYWATNLAVMSRNTCSNGPIIESGYDIALALKGLAEKAPTAQLKAEYARMASDNETFGDQLYNWMYANLRDPHSGLFWDHINDDGTIDKGIGSYNQGVMMGANLAKFKLTGDSVYLERANEIAQASVAYFSQIDSRYGVTYFYRQPPSFNAIFIRNLYALMKFLPSGAAQSYTVTIGSAKIRVVLTSAAYYQRFIDNYINQVRQRAFDPATGLYDLGHIGKYGDEVLDMSGLAQTFEEAGDPVLQSIAT
jgi:predicted alpha-1,6-mannanase (GH76 family)